MWAPTNVDQDWTTPNGETKFLLVAKPHRANPYLLVRDVTEITSRKLKLL